ncbi:TrmH family RNA methyltransferase [Blastopirellula marina]|uniref:RNA methyltransferase n=1 Tax=Blastopirellula marina TaxID=124 RepID=A0A2S8F6L4_9BACT|nr:RNA methyltransferase [Blastopirellula marina]PQO27796.1 RNA methyltransferase [Blastopirellula marina]PTL41536.1 RNA methyltransferase [Blastopirellula marina]
MEIIRSLQNTQIKAAVKLRDRRGRTQQRRTIIDGLREIRRALECDFPIETIYVDPTALAGPEAREFSDMLANVPPASITHVTHEVMAKLAFGERVEGAVAVAKIPEKTLRQVRLPECPLIAVIEQVEKPGNVGAILRTMDAVGANLLISADGRTDRFNPNAIRASLGTIFSVPVVDATSEETIEFLAEQGIQMLAARVDGSVPYSTVDMTQPTALILGSEAHGLSDKWHQAGITNIHLPMNGIADSLNVSTTAAVLLYEALRQRT